MAMASLKDFNDTLFELTDEMLTIINPSPVMTTAYGVFKNMYTANPDNDVAVRAFWDVAKDNAELIQKKDVQAMANVLRNVLPMPDLVDEVWNALSDENRAVVGDYVRVLYDQAADIVGTSPTSGLGGFRKERKDTTIYSMYNRMWRDFLLLLQSIAPDKVSDGRDKLEYVLHGKGPSTDMPFCVLMPCLELVLPKQAIANEADIVKLCLPPSDAVGTLRRDADALRGLVFPFDRTMPFSELLGVAVDPQVPKDKQERAAMFWHYIKLLTVCVQECPSEVVGMMNNMVGLFFQDD